MGLLFYIPAVFGILRHRHWPYWRWVIAMLVWVNVMWLLFADGGLVTGLLETTGHGFVVAILALPIVLLIWGGIFFIARQLYVEAKATGLGPASVKPVPGLRKGAELLALTLACGLALYLNVIAIFPRQEAKAEAPKADTLEAAIDRTVSMIIPTVPMKLDEITTMSGAAREGTTLVVDYEISSPDITREIMEDYLRNQKPTEACAIADTQKLHSLGGALRYRYKLASGGAPVEMTLRPGDCSAVGTKAAPALQ